MKKLWKQWLASVGFLLALGLAPTCTAEGFQFDQLRFLHATDYSRGVNHRSFGGLPLSASNTLANLSQAGDRGNAPATPVATRSQFTGFLSHGAVARPALTNLVSSASVNNYAKNARNLDLIRNASGDVTMVLTRAAAGAPYFSRPVAFLLGSVIKPPEMDETGRILEPNEIYWSPEPYSANNHATAAYYWSPHARAVFAIQSGPISVIWKKANPSRTQPSDYLANPSAYQVLAGDYYRLKTFDYIISGSSIKAPRKMFWTEETFSALGKPVTIPTTRISAVNVLYSSRFPERVSEAYVAVGQSFITPVATNRLQETRTLWYDNVGGQLRAYNQEGRVFIELLGDRVDNASFRHLGFEIIDVSKQPFPVEINSDLGETITPLASRDLEADLLAEPLDLGSPFLYEQKTPSRAKSDYYAVRETANLNDVLVHWTESGLQEIQWPKIFSRYRFVWPTDVAKYSHFVRPSVGTADAAALTAVQLPSKNIPTIQYQDVLDRPRAFLTDNGQFYTFVDSTYPAHRTLLRYLSVNQVAFERVFSWLDENLVAKNFTNTLAMNLTDIDYYYNNLYTTNNSAMTNRARMVAEYAAYRTNLTSFNRYVDQTNVLGNYLGELSALTTQRAAHSNFVNHVRDYNANGMHWDTANPMTRARRGSTATLLRNGKVLVAGGYNDTDRCLNTAEIYDPLAKTWTSTGNLTTKRYGHTATLLGDGRVLVAGGGDVASDTSHRTAEIYDPATEVWTIMSSTMSVEHVGATATLLQDGRVVVVGGSSWALDRDVLEVDVYNPNGQVWSSGASHPTGLSGHQATLLPDGQILVTGGFSARFWYGSSFQGRDQVLMYSPTYDSWQTVANLPTARAFHSSILLRNGKVLIAGGTTDGNVGLSSGVLYNPEDKTWSQTGPMPFPRMNHFASFLSNGQVLISQGLTAGFASETKTYSTQNALYYPELNIWTTSLEAQTPRLSGESVVLADGNVLNIGGMNNTGVLSSVELGTMPPVIVQAPSLSMLSNYGEAVTNNQFLAYAIYTNHVANYRNYTNQIPGFDAYPTQVEGYSQYITNLLAYNTYTNELAAFNTYTSQLASYDAYTNQVALRNTYLTNLARYNTYTNELAAYNTYLSKLAVYDTYTNDLTTYIAYTNQLAAFSTYSGELAAYNAYTNQLELFTSYPARLAPYIAYTNQIAAYNAYWAHRYAYNKYTNDLSAYQRYTNQLAAFTSYPARLAAWQGYTNDVALYNTYTNLFWKYVGYTNQLAGFSAYSNQFAAYQTYTNQLAGYKFYTNQLAALEGYTEQFPKYQAYTNQLAAYQAYTNQLLAYETYTNQLAGYQTYTNQLLAYQTYTNQLAGYQTYTNQLAAYNIYTNKLVIYEAATNQLAVYQDYKLELASYKTYTNQLASYHNYTNQLSAYQTYTNQLAAFEQRQATEVGYWRFGEGWGTSVGQGWSPMWNGPYWMPGSFGPGVTWVTGAELLIQNAPVKNALRFTRDFGTPYVQIPQVSPTIPMGGSFSIESWIYLEGGENSTIIDKGNYNFTFQAKQSGNTYGGLSFYNPAFGSWIHSTRALADHQWIHVAVTWNFQAHEMKFYINGETTLADTRSFPDVMGLVLDAGPLNLGRQSPDNCACNGFDGMLAEVRLSNVALDSDQIGVDMNGGNIPPDWVLLPVEVAQPDPVTMPEFVADPREPSGLVGYWKMDDGQGTAVQDSSTNGLNASLENGAYWVTDQWRLPSHLTGAVQFQRDNWGWSNGNQWWNPYISAPHSPVYNTMGGSFSIEAWINLFGGESSTIIDKGRYNFTLQARQLGNPVGGLSFSNPAFGDWTWIHSTRALPLSQWTHVALTWNAETHELIFYINGETTPEDIRTFPNVSGLVLNDGPLNIGRQSPDDCACNGFDGMLAEVRLSNVALDVSQIALDMSGEFERPFEVIQPVEVAQPEPVPEPDLVEDPNMMAGVVGYWKLDEGQGGLVYDSGPNGLTGSLQNGATWVTDHALLPPQVSGAVSFQRDDWAWINQSNTEPFIHSEHSSVYNSLGGDFTIEAWIYLEGGIGSTIIDKGNYNFTLQAKQPANLTGGLSFYNVAFGSWIHSTQPLPDRQWTHVALTWNTTTHELIFYVNGTTTPEDTLSFPQVSGLWLNNGPLNIGRQSPDNCQCNGFDGMLAEVRLFSVTRGPNQVVRDMNGGVQPPTQVPLPVEIAQPELVSHPGIEVTNPGPEIVLPPLVNQPTRDVLEPTVLVQTQEAGLVAHWKMNEGWSTPNDSGPNLLYGWYGPGVSWETNRSLLTAQVPNALRFTRTYMEWAYDTNTWVSTNILTTNGVPYFQSYNSPVFNSMSGDFSIEAWIYLEGLASSTIIDRGSYNFTLQAKQFGNNYGGLSFYNQAFGSWIHSTRPLPDRQWTHVAVTWNKQTHEFKFYVNGQTTSEDTLSFPNVWGLVLNEGPLNIGRQSPNDCKCNGFEGMLAGVKLYSVARHPDQVAADYRPLMTFPPNEVVLEPALVLNPTYVEQPWYSPEPAPVLEPELVTKPADQGPDYPYLVVYQPAEVAEPTVVVVQPSTVVVYPATVVSHPGVVVSRPTEVTAPTAEVEQPEVVLAPTEVFTKPATVTAPAAVVNRPALVAKPVDPGVPVAIAAPGSAVNPAEIVQKPTPEVAEPPPLPGWPEGFTGPQVVSENVVVGERIEAPTGELGSSGSYFAGYIRKENGTSYHSGAYKDPFVYGYEVANRGAIIPVNAIPGQNRLEVWWFRVSATNEIRNAVNDFGVVHWPSVIGRYTINWPVGGDEIVMANNEGSGGLGSLQAKGTIYTQNDPEEVGYNPNEEHALMLGGQAYALRDDLNLTRATSTAVLAGNGVNYSSAPFVLLDYIESDGRPAVRTFRVLREKPEAGELFDYVVMAGGNETRSGAGQILQAPMPLPFLPPPVDNARTNLLSRTNYNAEPSGSFGDLPVGWTASMALTYSNYNKFTFEDRKHNFWVVRGLHDGLPALEAGVYRTDLTPKRFETNLPAAFAVVGIPFTNTFHASRLIDSLLVTTNGSTPLPAGLNLQGLTLAGIPTMAGKHQLELIISDTGDGAAVRVTLPLEVFAAGRGYVHAQAPLQIARGISSGANAVYVGRPPFLTTAPVPTNSFTMRFYYKTQEGFAWPQRDRNNPLPVGTIVPYLRSIASDGTTYNGGADQSSTESLGIVYRPVWPGNPPTLQYGETLMTPKHGLPAVRGQTSAQILYQQSIAKTITNPKSAVILHDPTREKSVALVANGLNKIPDGVRTEYYQGKTYFPNLPPHLSQRVFFDSNRGTLGHLVLRGEFKDEVLGDDYLMLNVLRGTDLATVKGLCPIQPADQKLLWDSAVDTLSTAVQTYYENPAVPGQFITSDESNFRRNVGIGELPEITHSDTAVDSYALSASGPGKGYVTMIVGNGRAFTPEGDPITVYVMKVEGSLYPGEMKIVPSANPLSELVSFQHSADLAGRFDEFEYEWKMNPPVDGAPPRTDATMSRYQPLTLGNNLPRYTLGGSGVQALVDNYVVMRYRPTNPLHPLFQANSSAATATNWSAWTTPALAEGWIKRVLAGINPFAQRVTDLFSHGVNTDANILTSAGKRWEGDIALNLANMNNVGLIEVYETVLRRGRGLSIDAGINFGPANDALLLAAGYLNDLYIMVGNEAHADAANPTIGIGTRDQSYGDIATALFSFKGQLPTLLEEELALLRGRDDVLQPGVQTSPVYNRLVWNYTRGIDSGEVIYALNYNILDQNTDGKVDAADAAKLFPQGHGDAYGHYLTATKGYYSLLLNNKFDWVPRSEAVNVLGKPVSVDYLDERKFASSAAAVARTGRQIFDLTWRQAYSPGAEGGWGHLSRTRESTRTVLNGTSTNTIVRHWGADHWASRTMQGAFFNWVVGNAILPDIDRDPSHEGIQKIDRTTVPELAELPTTAADLQAVMDNAEGRLTPLGLAEGSLAFDINPLNVVGEDPQTHFDQIYARATATLNNAVASFDDAKDVTRLMRSEQDSLAELQASVAAQELAYNNSLIELYGTPYTDDIGPGKTYLQGYEGPDLIHYTYTDQPERLTSNQLDLGTNYTLSVDIQNLPSTWMNAVNNSFSSFQENPPSDKQVSITINSQTPFAKPRLWSGRRSSPGAIQQSISEFTAARNRLYQSLDDASGAKDHLLKSVNVFNSQARILGLIKANDHAIANTEQDINSKTGTMEAQVNWINLSAEIASSIAEGMAAEIPTTFIAGLAAGGDVTRPAAGAVYVIGQIAKNALLTSAAGVIQAGNNQIIDYQSNLRDLVKANSNYQLDLELKNAVFMLEEELSAYQSYLWSINERLRDLDDAERAYRSLVAQGDRLQNERQVYRQRAAAVVQGFRTRDAGFRIFRNEKLERYKTLFDLSARYAYLAATAYDYETGLLNTSKGKSFVNRIVSSRALGVVKDGSPQYAGSNTGDPGLSSALAEMKADWDVLKGRLGFNNPDTYGTTVSLRRENLRILPGTEGDATWQDVLNGSQRDNLLDDPDVRRHCLQIDLGDGLPVPGIVLTFGTTVDAGKNLFGRPLAAGDQGFDVSSFATKIFGMGVVLEGYQGMNHPESNSPVIDGTGGVSPTEPSSLDPKALAGTPYVYLIPVGVDSMRSPPLGDQSKVRTWTVNDVAIPLPFNISGSEFSTKKLYQSAESLAEPLFAVRKHQAFRPVSDSSYFSPDSIGGAIQLSQFTNRRLIGRSVWNSQWKIVIPGRTLLNDSKEGLKRFVNTVKDVKLHFVTYSYSGN